jgi:hypothetical protein
MVFSWLESRGSNRRAKAGGVEHKRRKPLCHHTPQRSAWSGVQVFLRAERLPAKTSAAECTINVLQY